MIKRLFIEYHSKYSFFIILLSLFLFINLGYYYCLAFPFKIYVFIYAWLLEFIAFGLAYETTELILCLTLRNLDLPRLKKLKSHPPVALLCCTCDDVNAEILSNHIKQTYSNLNIFILDDSILKKSRQTVNSLNIPVIRRLNRVGFKAGNLNNWLFNYGFKYKYFVVADADSIFPDDFIESMLLYAEHPKNNKVAIFESLIHAWNKDKKFVYYQNIMSCLTDRIKLRIENRFSSTLSIGHNNLLRTEPLLHNGGFDAKYIAEDYATSLEILSNGLGECKTLPIISYERLPENFNEYAKRKARWAFQTFQLTNLNVSRNSFNIKLKLIRSIHYYSEPIIVILGIVFMILYLFSYSSLYYSNRELMTSIMNSRLIVFWFLFLFSPYILRLLLQRIQGISICDGFKSTIFHGALFVATAWPIICRLSGLFVNKELEFNVTGITNAPSFSEILKRGGPIFILFWLVLLLMFVFNPMAGILNLIWILPSSMSPFIIYHYQKANL